MDEAFVIWVNRLLLFFGQIKWNFWWKRDAVAAGGGAGSYVEMIQTAD